MVYFELFEALDPAGTVKVLVDRSKRVKAKRQYEKALRYLDPVREKDYFTDQGRLELATLYLKTGRQSFARSDRHADPALALLSEIVRTGEVDILKALKAQAKFLKPDDYYYIGFHFSEKDGDEKELGAKLLQFLVKKSPRSKIGKLARNKMNIESIP